MRRYQPRHRMTRSERKAFRRALRDVRRIDFNDVGIAVLSPPPAPPKREPLAVEGLPTVDGRLLKPGSLSWPDRVPLTVPGDYGSTVIGAVYDIQRGDDGIITGLLDWGTRTPEPVQSVGVDVTHVDWAEPDDEEGTVLAVESGRIVGVTVLATGWAWPGVGRDHA